MEPPAGRSVVRRYGADAILILHFALVAFNAAGLLLTWLGAGLGWPWVRNRAFRLAHLAAIGVVAVGALLGAACPLTAWEDALRGGAPPVSFVARWVSRLLYHDPPEWVFTTLYVAWAAATVATLLLVPPRRRSAARGR